MIQISIFTLDVKSETSFMFDGDLLGSIEQILCQLLCCSGLEADLDKSNVYFGGVSEVVRNHILDALKIPTWKFPF